MAKALRTIAVVAGAVALIATGIGAIGGATFAATALGGTIATIGTWAGVIAGVAGIGAQLLTKPPPARGSVTETIIDVNPPSPYGMGEGYFGGVLRHKVGYGPTLKKVPNPFLFEAVALCVAGPIAGPIVPQVDFGPVTGYYSGWLATDTRLGQRPDTALSAPLQANPTGWSTNHRLSGVAAIAWNHKFDKDGKVYASGLPTRGVVAKWALCYDPRKDSTRPGGSGPHRLGVESTYEWSENPALHAGTYAFGRYVNGKRVIGVGLPDEGIDWEGVAAWANDCQANGWRMFGFVFEGTEDDAQRRWQNLRDICIAGGAEPLFSGAVLGFHWQRPRVPLDTVTEADLADGPQEVTAMKSWRDRLNTVRPRYTSPTHNWSLVQAQQVQVTSYLAEDGEERAEDIPFNFVKDVNQAAQLAAYWLTNSRELTPITLTLMPRLRHYRPGECLRLQLPELGLDHDAVILRREFDPASMTVTLTLVTEDPAKHAFALGRTGVAPPTPSLTNSAEDRDTITREARAPYWPEVDGPGRPEDGATNTAPANANRVPFSQFENQAAWYVSAASGVTGGALSFPTIGGLPTLTYTATAGSAGNFGSFKSARFRVQGGERLSCQARMSTNIRSEGRVTIRYFDASGAAIVAQPEVMPFAGIGTPEQYLFQGFTTAPANAVAGELEIFVPATAAGALSASISQPMVTSAAPGQTAHPDYTPGPNASDGADPNNLITVDGAGIISGIGTANIFVDNRRTVLSGPAAARPASGSFPNQTFAATDTGDISQWDGFNWRPAADITATVSGVGEIVLDYNSTGQLQTALPVLETYSLIARGIGAYTSGVSWSVTVLTGSFAGAAPSISGSGSGQLSINSDMTSPEALLRLTPSLGGQSFPPFAVKIVKSVAVALSNPSVTDTLVGPSTSSFTTVGEVTITLGSSTTAVNLNAAALALRTANTNLPLGESTVEMKWTRETTFGGGVFVDVGAVETSSPNPGVVADGEGFRSRQVGSITCNRSATGLTAGSQQRFRLVGRISAGNVRTTNATGTASVTP